ncbi:MAG: hypothetical protein EP344_13585 [Bacteroidetes bacterium]|nr:MAG: hypothetical protein EP344_13585 [Bacteroidota bacterium]
MNFFQNSGTLLAIAISMFALMVSVYEANLHKAEQKAMVWPYLAIIANYDKEGLSYIASNNGTGPAVVRSVEVRYFGRPLRDYDALLDRIKPGHQIGYNRLRINRLNKTVLRAGEVRELFFMPWDAETRQMADCMAGGLTVRIQYCSVLEDCWVFDSETGDHTPGEFKAEVEFDN